MIPVIKPTPKQYEAWKILQDKETSVLFFGGGAGGGKSWMGCEFCIYNSYVFPGSKGFIARKELKRLMLSTYITFQKVLTFHGIPKEDFHLEGKYNVIRNKRTGSTIDLIDASWLPAEDPLYERFGSLEYTYGWMEEGPEMKFAAFDVLNSRIGRHMNKELGLLPAKLLVTGNPSKGWPYKTFYRPWRDKTLPPEYKFIQSLYNDNPFTSAEYGKQLALIRDKSQRDRLMHGNWEFAGDASSLMDYEAILDVFERSLEKEGLTYLVVDAARLGNDRIVMAVWRGLSVIKVVIRRKQTLPMTSADMDTLCDKYGIPRNREIIDEDGVGGGLVDMRPGCNGFVANRIPLIDPNDTDADGNPKRPNFRNLKAQCAYLLADYINGRKISAAGRSEGLQAQIVEELEQVRAKIVETRDAPLELVSKDEVREAIGRSPDLGDTFIMRMWFELHKPRVRTKATRSSSMDVGRRWRKST